MAYEVRIMQHGVDEPVKVMPASSERSADRIDSGVNINLNHEEYYTLIEEV